MNDRQRVLTPSGTTQPATPRKTGALADQAPLWPPGFGAWIKIGVVYQRTSARLAALLRPLSLTVAQFDALANLFVEDGISQQDLAKRLLVTKGNVSGLVDRLAARGLVERQTDAADARRNLIAITKAGRRLARQALQVQRGLVDEMMKPLARHERQQLRDLLEQLIGGLVGKDRAPSES